MKSSGQSAAESKFREAFSRLKNEAPERLPKGTSVSQNNVAKEAGCDPSALRKSRFPGLVADIQSYIAEKAVGQKPSDRQRLLKDRQKSRSAVEINRDLKAQRDATASLLLDANSQISVLTKRIRDLEARLAERGDKSAVITSITEPTR